MGKNYIETAGTFLTQGTSGVNGSQGVSGTSGTSGTSGSQGIQGVAGTNGTSGINGTNATSTPPLIFIKDYIQISGSTTGTTVFIINTTNWVNTGITFIPANSLAAGSTYRLRTSFTSYNITDTTTRPHFNLYFNEVKIADSVQNDVTSGYIDQTQYDWDIVVKSIGTSGSIRSLGVSHKNTASSGTIYTSLATINTTVNNTISFRYACTNAGSYIVMYNTILEKLN